MALFGTCQLGLGLVLLTFGMRRVPATRAALISLLDAPLAPLWVWLAFRELPPVATLIGGGIVAAAVLWNMASPANRRRGGRRSSLTLIDGAGRQDLMHLMLVQGQREHPQSEEASTQNNQQEKNENQQETTHSVDLPLETRAVLAWGVMTSNNALEIPVPGLPAQRAGRSIVLVGLMGAGKTAAGKRLAAALRLPFVDADQEVETAAGYSVSEIFQRFGEPAFRDVERRVIRRLLEGPRSRAGDRRRRLHGQGDADAVIRAKGLSIWIRASLPLLLKRVAGRTHRPLLMSGDPAPILQGLIDLRHPIYAEADIVIDSRDEPVDSMAARLAEAVLRA